MDNNEIDFIARRYRKGLFSPEAGWRQLGIAPPTRWRRYRIAAAVSAVVILSATAAILYREYRADDAPQPDVSAITASPMAEVRVIDFENAPLPDVITKIESVYGVKVENIPQSPEKYILSLHYEGTPDNLIAVINDILETRMTVIEK